MCRNRPVTSNSHRAFVTRIGAVSHHRSRTWYSGAPLVPSTGNRPGRQHLPRQRTSDGTRHRGTASSCPPARTHRNRQEHAAGADGPVGPGGRPGLVLLDPKGDLVQAVLERVPEHRRRDVIVLDPADTARPVGLNPLRSATGASGEVVVENLVGLFKSLYRHSWGPRLDDILRAALLTLAGSEGSTLCEVAADPHRPELPAAAGRTTGRPGGAGELLGLVRGPVRRRAANGCRAGAQQGPGLHHAADRPVDHRAEHSRRSISVTSWPAARCCSARWPRVCSGRRQPRCSAR